MLFACIIFPAGGDVGGRGGGVCVCVCTRIAHFLYLFVRGCTLGLFQYLAIMNILNKYESANVSLTGRFHSPWIYSQQ